MWNQAALERLMHTYRRAGTVIFVSTRSPEATIAQDIEAHGLVMQWAKQHRGGS